MKFWTEIISTGATKEMKEHIERNGGSNYLKLLILDDMAREGMLIDEALKRVRAKLEAKKE